MSDTANPFAPPAAEVADIAEGGSAVLGTRGNRLLAVVIDGLLQVAVLWVLSLLLPWKVFSNDGTPWGLMVNGLLGCVIFVALQGWLLVRQGQTVGKRLLGLRIVRSDGSRVGAWRMLLLRYGLGWLFVLVPMLGAVYGLIDSLLIFRASRRCLHDQIADTIVVRAA